MAHLCTGPLSGPGGEISKSCACGNPPALAPGARAARPALRHAAATAGSETDQSGLCDRAGGRGDLWIAPILSAPRARVTKGKGGSKGGHKPLWDAKETHTFVSPSNRCSTT